MSDSNSDNDYTPYWVEWFLSLKGNEYFVEVDEEYITDRFNLTGLNLEVNNYSLAMDLINDSLKIEDKNREIVEKSAKHLYGLIHARFLLTSRGLQKILEKFKANQYGKCPRTLCQGHPLLPVGLYDAPNIKSVKVYCASCEDVYNPKSTRHSNGAYFGTSMPHMFYQAYSHLLPAKNKERYIPRIFGIQLKSYHEAHLVQDEKRIQQQNELQLSHI